MATNINNQNGLTDLLQGYKNKVQQDLVLLGILSSGPMHGYDVRKEIDEKLAPLMGIKSRSIYYSLDRLEKRGLLESESARAGKRPKKFVYKLTKNGRKELHHLLLANLLDMERPCMNLNLSLFFFHHIEPEAFEHALKERLKMLKETYSTDMKSIIRKCGRKKKDCIEKITEHNQRMLKEELSFTRKLLSEIKKRSENKKTARTRK